MEVLNVNSLHHFLAVGDRRLLESLTGTQFFDDTGLLGFTLEFLKGALDVVAFLHGNNNHNEFVLFLMFYLLLIVEFLQWFAALYQMEHRQRATCRAMPNRMICIDNQSLKAGFTTPFRFLAPQSYAFLPQPTKKNRLFF